MKKRHRKACKGYRDWIKSQFGSKRVKCVCHILKEMDKQEKNGRKA